MEPAHCEPPLGPGPSEQTGPGAPKAGQSPGRCRVSPAPRGWWVAKGLRGPHWPPDAESLSKDGLEAPSFRRKRRRGGRGGAVQGDKTRETEQLQLLLFLGEICPQTVNKTPLPAVSLRPLPRLQRKTVPEPSSGREAGRSLSGRHHHPKPLFTVQQKSAKHPVPGSSDAVRRATA